jgi:N-acetylmuramoyl-L-alanine amidase
VGGRPIRILGAVLGFLLVPPQGAAAQDAARGAGATFRVENQRGEVVADLDVYRPEGEAMIRLSDLEQLGAAVRDQGEASVLAWGGHEILLEAGVPVVAVDGVAVQLMVAPIRTGGDVYAPMQLFTDVLPDRVPDVLLSDGSSWRAILLDEARAARRGIGSDAVSSPPVETPYDGPRVVIIDPGHGGEDPGAVGPTGVREKDVALAVARALADILEDDPDFEVHLTRTDDRLVPLWERGPVATALKGERPGLFLSIHMNAVSDRAVRGFETYFLSDGRMTEHERRVVALENAAMAFGERGGTDPSADPELGSILNELRNFDHQRWSADLAGVVQERLETVHPAANRGVKQGPLAVITNSIMPSVLVELGFISNRDEERALSDAAFQRAAAGALAEAIRSFFERYPPGTGGA